MKLTKSLIIGALVVGSLFAGGMVLQAQDSTNTPPAAAPRGGGRGMRGGPTLDQIATALNLDDATKAKVKPIIEDRDKKIKDLMADTTVTGADRRTKMQTIRQETEDALKKVLTPEQFAKYQAMPQGRGRRGGNGGGNPPPANPPAAPQN